MIRWLCDNYGGELHISLGMTRRSEEIGLVKLLYQSGRLKDTTLYACTSGYPVPSRDVCLLEITRLKEMYGGSVKAIGFSGHHVGISLDTAAAALGASCIERHFTLNRAWRGTDHSASLEPDGLARLKQALLSLESALRYKHRDILDIELPQRKKLKSDAHTYIQS
jgi:sialic acid synthase SpsE